MGIETESSSGYDNLEQMSVRELLLSINREDKTVPLAVEKAIPQIERVVEVLEEKLKAGGRLFYIGAGTSGRLGVVDASECPPTYGIADDIIVGIIAGGDKALRMAVESVEDDYTRGWEDLQAYNLSDKDFVLGIAASGSTPYVVGAIEQCRQNGIRTGCITCNRDTRLASLADFPIEIIVGPEFVSGSTRMKAGTAQKLTLNMISTSLMIRLGKVKGNNMVDMQLNNNKLFRRGIRILVDQLGISDPEAEKLLMTHRNVRNAIDWYRDHA